MNVLPHNATPLEKALAESMDTPSRLNAAVTDMRGAKLGNAPDSFLAHMIIERGLGPLTAFLSQRDALTEGRVWQRIRGTQSAITQALGWIDYNGTVENFPTRRRRWNNFMLALSALPNTEEPDLHNIETLVGLSVPLRSKFVRGFRTYDVRAVDYSHTRWSDVAWSSYSGARINPAGAKWSFGRDYQQTRAMTQSELTALDVWIPVGGAPLTWGAFSWEDANAPWASSTALTRRQLIASGLINKSIWLKFSDADGVIGYRRARVARGVTQDSNGVYQIGSTKYAVNTEAPEAVYVEFMTDFGNGYGRTATSVQISFGLTTLDETKPGLLWALPAQLTGTEITISTSVPNIQFRRTVRERYRALLTF